uniref:CSON010821 protein n=1 Tax=Culicoides sonorensis TaxID=179676 RepID=A0A336M670_CULSO
MGKKSTKNFPAHNFIRITFIFCFYLNTFASAESLTPCELEQVLSEIMHPDQGYELQSAALRSQLRNLIDKQMSEDYQNVDGDPDGLYENYDKRSIATLAREGHLKGSGKRNVGALARSGILRAYQMDAIKRSLATLAKNGHLPSSAPSSKDPDDESDETQSSEKRSLSSLARSGNFMLNGKRSIVSMVRNRIHPQAIETSPKRNLAALARGNLLVPTTGKRNIGILARDWVLPNHQKSQTDKRDTSKVENGMNHEEEKRNVGALKNSPVHGVNSNKQKREVAYTIMDETSPELIEPNYQSSPFDYEELAQAMDDAYPLAYAYKNTDEKRYLGALMRSGYRSGLRGLRNNNKRYVGALAKLGMLRSSGDSLMNFRQRPEKRHVGAAFRPDITPHTTYAVGPSSTEFVDDVIPALQTSLTGIPQDYLAQQQIGAKHINHREFLPSIGENFDHNPYYHHQYSEINDQQKEFNDNSDNNFNLKQDMMFNLASIDPLNRLENLKQMQCYKRLKTIYVQIMTENDMPYNDLNEIDLF